MAVEAQNDSLGERIPRRDTGRTSPASVQAEGGGSRVRRHDGDCGANGPETRGRIEVQAETPGQAGKGERPAPTILPANEKSSDGDGPEQRGDFSLGNESAGLEIERTRGDKRRGQQAETPAEVTTANPGGKNDACKSDDRAKSSRPGHGRAKEPHRLREEVEVNQVDLIPARLEPGVGCVAVEDDQCCRSPVALVGLDSDWRVAESREP